MFGFQFFKGDPSSFVMRFKNGKVKQQGTGSSFFYYAPTSSVVVVPLNSKESSFAFRTKTKDFQEVSIQGQVAYRISDPVKAAQMLNFTVSPKGEYLLDDPEKIEERVLRSVQVLIRNSAQTLPLRQALVCAQTLSTELQASLPSQGALQLLGIEINEVAVTAVVPTPETGKALEADMREQLLKDADAAIYERRLASIDQERQVQEKELAGEQALAIQQQAIEQQKLCAEREQMQQRFAMSQEQIEAQTADESKRTALVELKNNNAKAKADSRLYELKGQLAAYESIDIERLKIMSMVGLKPEQLIAQAIENLTKGENQVGNLNISPELFQALTK